MKISGLNNKKEAYKVFFISLLLFLVFFLSPFYLIYNEPSFENLKSYNGISTNPRERISRYSKHIEFNIKNNKFYYSGKNYEKVKSLVFSKKQISLKAYKNHGVNDTVNVIYTLTYQSKDIVTFKNSTQKLNKTIWLLFMAAIASLAGLIYGYRQINKFT